jgi:hypothetical protein
MTRVTRYACVLFLGAVATLISTTPLPADDADGPRILIEEKRHDLGDVYERESYVWTFTVKNTGSEDLFITDVKPGCGCTVAEFDEVIAPGATGSIKLEIDGAKVSDRFSKAASVHSNDPKRPNVSISLAGNILHHIEVEPERVYLRGMYGEHVERAVALSSGNMKKDFRILGVTSNMDDKLTYRLVDDPEPGTYSIHLFKNPKLPTMNTWGNLIVQTNHKESPEKIIQVNVVTIGSIIVQPNTVNFGNVPASSATSGESVEQEITVFAVRGDFNITNIEFSSAQYQASVEPIEDGKKYKVTVGFRPEMQRRNYSDEMLIKTDDPSEPSLRVRLVARGV